MIITALICASISFALPNEWTLLIPVVGWGIVFLWQALFGYGLGEGADLGFILVVGAGAGGGFLGIYARRSWHAITGR